MTTRKLLALVWALVSCLVLVHNAYLWLGRHWAPDTDILALLPSAERDAALRQALTQIADSAQQRLVVLFGAKDWAQSRRGAEAYGAVIQRYPGLLMSDDTVSAKNLAEGLALFRRHRSPLMTAGAQAALRSESKNYWVDVALRKLYAPFAGPNLGAWRDDPFDLFRGWLQARTQETPLRLREGHLFVSDGARQFAVLLIKVRIPVFALSAQHSLMPILDKAEQAARQAAPGVELVMAGVILHAFSQGRQASQELSVIGIGSIAGIALLTWLTFRSLKPIGLVMISIAIGCVGALSLSWLIFERVHLVTLVFGASLIGVAQDYGIYFICHRIGAEAQPDSWCLLRRLLPGLSLAVATTAVGYISLALTPFPGLRQMAVFSVAGLLFAWLTVVFWFPVLISSATFESAGPRRWFAAGRAQWQGFSLNRRSVFAAALVCVCVGAGLSRLATEDDIRSLSNSPPALINDQVKVNQLLDPPSPARFFLVRGRTAEVVLQREEGLKEKLELLAQKRLISGYQAISNWVPSTHAQEVRRELIEMKLVNAAGPLAEVAARIGADGAWFGATRDRLLESGGPIDPEELLNSRAGAPWRHLWVGKNDGVYASIVAVRGAGKQSLAALAQTASGLDGVQWVDKVEEISTLLGRYRHYIGWALIVSYVAVYGLLWCRYRGETWRVLAPTALASIATLALLGLLGQPLQLFHVLALMLMLGIGVDYSIFLFEHFASGDDTAWLVVDLSALSTLLSFGLLSLSGTPALHAFGLTMLFGTVSVWLIVPILASSHYQNGNAGRASAGAGVKPR